MAGRTADLPLSGVADPQLSPDVRECLAVYGCLRALAAAVVALTIAVRDAAPTPAAVHSIGRRPAVSPISPV
jgi:hypothetical protein